jgi:hypothetical protein
VPNLLKIPADLHMGEASGVAVNSKKHIFVYSRGNSSRPAYAATASQILEFGPDGKYIREIGHNLYAWSYAHTWKRVTPPRPAVDGQFQVRQEWRLGEAVGRSRHQAGRVQHTAQYRSRRQGKYLRSGSRQSPHSVFDSDGNFLGEIHINVPAPPVIHPWMGAVPTAQALASDPA